MTVFGIDISHHQGSFDVERAAREGIDFFIFKATEGSGFVDKRFKENLAKARRTGKPFAAYHYQRQGISAAAQVTHIRRVVPKDVPIILDVEANSGHVSLTRDIINRLHRIGYTSPLLYLPRWYWQQIGSPSLAGLPPLWSSRYPDNRIGDLRDEYADVPAHFWDGYGGLRVAVLQFTSSARVAGRSPIDGNAYRGTLNELRALFGATGGGGAAGGKGDDMELTDPFDEKIITKMPGTYGHTILNVKQNAAAARKSAETTETKLVGLTAAVDKLAEAVAANSGITPGELKTAVAEAIAEGTVNVDVTVRGGASDE